MSVNSALVKRGEPILVRFIFRVMQLSLLWLSKKVFVMPVDYPQINTEKKVNEFLNVINLIPLPAETPFGNMLLKHMKIVTRLDYVNRKLKSVYADWRKAVSDKFDPWHSPTEHLLHIEEIAYFLRVTTDELISLCYLLYEHTRSGSYPTHLKVDSIGGLLNMLRHESHEDVEFCQIFFEFEDWLNTINNVTNAYKHSFINSDINVIGRNEPCVPVLSLPKNNLNKHEVSFYCLSLAELIDGFNRFYKVTTTYARQSSPGHLANESGSSK